MKQLTWAGGAARLSSSGRRLRLNLVTTALLGLLTIYPGVNAQTAAPSPTSAPGTEARAELLTALRRIDAQLATLAGEARPEDTQRLLELKAQFEVLILQAELETLRRENAALQTRQQTGGQTGSGGQAQAQNQVQNQPQTQSGGGAEGSAAALGTEMSTMRRQFSRLAQQQKNVTKQLKTIERQHTLLLRELAGANTPAPPSPQETPPELQAELNSLRSRFAQLSSQQGVIDAQLKTITGQHAELLDQLGAAGSAASGTADSAAGNTVGNTAVNVPRNTVPSSTTPQTYVVKPGDSLSKISKAFYGTGARWPELLEANPSLNNPNQLFSGTVLVIP